MCVCPAQHLLRDSHPLCDVPQGQVRLLRLRFAALLSAMRPEDFCEGCNYPFFAE